MSANQSNSSSGAGAMDGTDTTQGAAAARPHTPGQEVIQLQAEIMEEVELLRDNIRQLSLDQIDHAHYHALVEESRANDITIPQLQDWGGEMHAEFQREKARREELEAELAQVRRRLEIVETEAEIARLRARLEVLNQEPVAPIEGQGEEDDDEADQAYAD